MDKKLNPIIGRFGGKTRLKKKIVDDYFIEGYENMTYVEPFIGGGSIFFYKNRSKKEVINDLDKNVISVYKGIQKYNATDIENEINGTYTKNEFIKIREFHPKTEYETFLKNLYLFKASYFCLQQSYNDGRNKISMNLDGYKERLKGVTILNEDYKNVIKKYDSPNTFFYLDPPYEESKGLYKNHEMDIEEMFNILDNIKGYFLLSYNLSKRAKELFKNYNIYKVKTSYTTNLTKVTLKSNNRFELLISNY